MEFQKVNLCFFFFLSIFKHLHHNAGKVIENQLVKINDGLHNCNELLRSVECCPLMLFIGATSKLEVQ